MKPTVGRIVLYTPPDACRGADVEHYAAMVTNVNADGTVELVTFGPNSVYFQHAVHEMNDDAGGGWSWPPRV